MAPRASWCTPSGSWVAATRANEFQFMGTEVSREKPVNYEELAFQLEKERRAGGYVLWVAGPALVHSRARSDFEWFIRSGYVQAALLGNAVAVHDMEAAIFGTTLGMSNTGVPTDGGHGLHMRAINRVRAAGIDRERGEVGAREDAASCTRSRPAVCRTCWPGRSGTTARCRACSATPSLAQEAMREHTVLATGAVFIATALHAIAVGNMLPAFHTRRGPPEPLMTICVDQTEFVVNKLKDRGTHQAFGVVTNAQDFMHVLRFYVEQARAAA